jgi:flagellum-specific ATP synthase
MLIRIGAYVQGTDRELDEAMAKKVKMEAFLSQESMSITHFQETIDQLIDLMES